MGQSNGENQLLNCLNTSWGGKRYFAVVGWTIPKLHHPTKHKIFVPWVALSPHSGVKDCPGCDFQEEPLFGVGGFAVKANK